MQDVKILTVSDLLRYGRSHTGSSTPAPQIISDQPPQPPAGPSTSNPSPDFKPLAQLEYPAILVGDLRLPGILTLKCPHQNCLEFSDDSVAVCCDIIGFDTRAIGKKINVLTWNFITSDGLSGGFLEIVKWDLSDSSCWLSRCSSLTIDSIPILSRLIKCVSKNSNDKSYRIHGMIGAVSPVSVVPCPIEESSSNKTMNLRGFQVRLMTCECNFCCSQETVGVVFEPTDSHSFTAPVLVYFCGPAWCWHPVLTRLIGNVVMISGLTKKMILIGKQEPFLMFVTVDNTILHLPRSVKKRKVVCGSYKGTVKNVYMEGRVVELDKVWLLLTNQSLKPSHGLRIGSVISIRNVHFVDPQFSWAKTPVLGACFNTSVIVKSFSPLETRCLTLSRSQSQFGNFIEMLGFSTRLWVLLLVSCFQKSFSGIFSGKELLGSRENEGLIQKFARSHLPPSVFRARHGVLKEFSKHESLCTGTEPCPGNLKLVVSISSFIHHCKTLWIKARLPLDNILPVSCVGKYYQPSKRKIFRSEDLGIILVGMLKISPSSGRLQLVDMTGSIDVVIPDLPYFWDHNCIFEVIDYFLIVEGMHESELPELTSDDSSLPRSIIQGFPSARKPNLKIFVYFHLRIATCSNRPIYPSNTPDDQLSDTRSGIFHLIYITRKVRPTCHSMKLERPVFAEAVVMPWYLFLAGKDGSIHQDKVLIDCTVANQADHSSSKRQKMDCASTLSGTCFKDNFCGVCFEEGTSLRETCGDQSCLRTSFSHEIPCSAVIQGVNKFIFTSSGTLYRIKANAKIRVCEGRARKCFLAFASECDLKYQLLQIGGVYLMKHHKEGPLCNIKTSSSMVVTVPITSGTYLRRLSFSSEDLATDKLLHNSSLCNEVFTKDQVLAVASGTSTSDIHLQVSSSFTGLFESDIKELGNDQNESDANPGRFTLSLDMKTRMNTNLIDNSGLLGHNRIFPSRKFTSLCGDIIAVHSIGQGSDDMCSSREDYGDHGHCGFCDRTKIFCIHVSVADQTVKIFGFVKQYLFPTGFGRGINATFHQIFDLRPRVPSTLMLTCESSIVINSIRAVDETHISDANLKRLRCRVVAVYVLVLEKSNRKCDGLNSNMQSRPLNVDIPLACFILDDGSCSWCCWANAERAATLLRLEEYHLSRCEARGYKRRRVGVHHLERILEKHDRITVKSRSVFDPFGQDFSVTAGSGGALIGLDDDFDFVASVISNACINTFRTVVTEVMDSNAVNLVKEHLVEMQMPMPMPSMENLWAR